MAPDDCLIFQSHQGAIGKPHTPDDHLRLRVHMVEAMDDSILLMPTLTALQTAALHADRFQATYGWETNWSKSLLYATQAPTTSGTVPIPSVDPSDPDSPNLTNNPVPITTDFFDFLRVQVNDPDTQYDKIRQIISNFSFPHLPTRLPLTALRRVLTSCLISRIRPYLSYQPLARSSALCLDHLLAHHVHDYLGFPFRFNSQLLFAPLSDLGFDFRSLVHLNDTAALQGLLRDLNHHVSTFRTMARITLADWTCMYNKCRSPLEGTVSRSFSRLARRLPAAWVTAHDVLREFGLSIRLTDQSYLVTGEVALRHIVRGLPPPPSSPDSLSITNLERAGITHLSQLASWTSPSTSSPVPPQLIPHAHLHTALQPFAAGRDWPRLQLWLMRLSTLADLVHAAAGAPPLGPFDHRWELALPRSTRRDIAELQIRAAATASPAPPLNPHLLPPILASDASAVDIAPPLSQPSKHVTFAAASTTSAVLMSVAPSDRLASSLHGEVLGLIAATLLHLDSPAASSPVPPTLYTDHLNSVRFIDSHNSLPSFSLTSSFTPALSVYRWLLDLRSRFPNSPRISYTPAHTSSASIPARANAHVDALASSPAAHSPSLRPPSLPLPTFTLPDYTLHSPAHGYVESNLQSFLASHASSLASHSDRLRPNLLLFRPLYDQHTPPPHPYTRASSAYSAAVQLYARSSQLDTAFTRFARLGDCLPWCHAGCNAIETMHHIFVQCPSFDGLRQSALQDLIRDTSEQLAAAETTPPLTEVVLRITSALFSDSVDVWPQYTSRYYFGTMPPLRCTTASNMPATQRLLTRVVHGWHIASIRLAGRIWGVYKRRTSPRRSAASPADGLSLPPHLQYLLH
ncbi:hypothetical protein OH77DRAFT_1391885 [Trametes cingulata]|nr:hypothetical protein OH77DRAFT_1391885 [Trametes cingulata]